MIRLIQQLRQKPKFVQSQVAFFVALVATGIVATVWVTTLPARFAPENASSQEADVLTATKVLESAKDFVDTVGDAAGAFKNQSSSGSAVQNPFGETSAPASAGSKSVQWATVSTSTSDQSQKSIQIQTTSTPPKAEHSVSIATSSVEEKVR